MKIENGVRICDEGAETVKEFYEIVLSHDPERVQQFFRERGRNVPERKTAFLMSYAYICNETFFTAEEQAEAEKWLRDHGYEYLIHKKTLN